MVYKTGQIVEGKVTGIQPYGAFVMLDEHTNGLIHISEISDGFVRDIEQFVSVGEIVRVKIIDYDEITHQARLSLKALHKTRVRNRKRSVVHRASLPEMEYGFSTIALELPHWIQQAKEKRKHD